jgi:hypothetical protein
MTTGRINQVAFLIKNNPTQLLHLKSFSRERSFSSVPYTTQAQYTRYASGRRPYIWEKPLPYISRISYFIILLGH